MPRINVRGRCPVCGLYMKSFRTHYCRDKELTFPYDIYRCEKHGIYVWHQDRHELIDFSDLQHDVEQKQLPEDASVQWFDPTIVNMKCPICGEKWTQYRDFPSPVYGGVVFCPNDHSVERGLALQK